MSELVFIIGDKLALVQQVVIDILKYAPVKRVRLRN